MDSLRKIKKALHINKLSDASDPGFPEWRPDIYEHGSTTIVDKWGRDRRLRHSRSLSELQRYGSHPAWMVDSGFRDPAVWAHPNHKKRHIKPSDITYILDIKADDDDDEESSNPMSDMPVLEMNRRYPSERRDSDRPPPPPPKDPIDPNDGFRTFVKGVMSTSLQTPGDPPPKPRKPKTMDFDSISDIDPGLDLLPPNPTYNPERRIRFLASIERERREEMAAREAAHALASRERRERGLAKFEQQQRQARAAEREQKEKQEREAGEEADRLARRKRQEKAFKGKEAQLPAIEREQKREREGGEEADRLARRKRQEKAFKKEAQLPAIEREQKQEREGGEEADRLARRKRQEKAFKEKEAQLPDIEREQRKWREHEEADRLARRELHEKTFKEKEAQLPAIEREQRKRREREEADHLARRDLQEKTFKEKEAQLRAPLQRSTSANVAPLRGMPFPKEVQGGSLGTSHARYWFPKMEEADENGFRTQEHGVQKHLISNPTPFTGSQGSKMSLERNEHLRDGPTAHRVVVHQTGVSVDLQPTRPLNIRKNSIDSTTSSTRPLHVRPRNPSLDSTASKVTPFLNRSIHERLRDPTSDIPREVNPIHLVDPEAILPDTQRPRRFKVSLETEPIYRDESGFFRPISHARKLSQSSTHTTPAPGPISTDSPPHARNISIDSHNTPSRSRKDSSASTHNPPSVGSARVAGGIVFPKKKQHEGPPPSPSQRHRGERITEDRVPSRSNAFKRPHIEPLRGNSHLHV